MRPADSMNGVLKKLKLKASADLDKKVHNDISGALARYTKSQSIRSESKLWRSLMKNRRIHLATAATVILIVSLIFHWSDTSIVPPAYAISDMPALLYSADNVHMKGTLYFTPQRSRGGKTVAVRTEHWLDLANGRWKMTWPGFGGGGGVGGGSAISEVSIEEKICDGGKREIVINHNRKTYYYNSISEFQRHLFCLRHAKQLVRKAIGSPDLYDSCRIVGQEEISGKTFEIWEVVQENQGRMLPFKMRSWLSPETGEFAKVITWKRQSGGSWEKSTEIDSIRRNIEMPDEIFSAEPLEGYRLERPRKTAPSGLTSVRASVLSINFCTHILFAMSDGSIIVCWSCEDSKSRASQARLFENLEMGGPLPKLPFEVSALKATHKGKKVKYDGYHLAHTVKKGKFHEWGLYVPVGETRPEYPEAVSYSFVYEDNANKTYGNTPSSYGGWVEFTIKNEKDFDIWIRGAMAELSDNGSVPEDVTFESVTTVIDSLRASP